MIIQLPSKNYAKLTLFDNNKRDLLLIMPGGGYEFTSPREGEPVAKCFAIEGYHTAIYYYRREKLIYPDTLIESKRLLDELNSHPLVNKIIVMGFSAGGHLAASMLVTFTNIVKGAILAYPVITADKRYRHEGSFINLLGNNFNEENLNKVSIEKHINEKVGPVFIFHTNNDDVVPIENATLLIEALNKNKIPVEAHIFSSGPHGVSLANEQVAYEHMTPSTFVKMFGHLNPWVNLAKQWLKTI